MGQIKIKPTLRQNGTMMFPVRVEFTVGRDQFVGIATRRALDHEKLPETRHEWIELLLKGLHEWGYPGIHDADFEDYSQLDVKEARELAEQRIDSLFPDLKTPATKAG